MMFRLALALASLPLVAGSSGASAGPPTIQGVERPERARQNYIVKCQGCHGPDADGNSSMTPPLAGMVSRFLAIKGGREFLARVPGVATAAVDDASLAELLNWTLFRFDAANVPGNFRPYSASEMARLRKSPLRTEASGVRSHLIDQIVKAEAMGK